MVQIAVDHSQRQLCFVNLVHISKSRPSFKCTSLDSYSESRKGQFREVVLILELRKGRLCPAVSNKRKWCHLPAVFVSPTSGHGIPLNFDQDIMWLITNVWLFCWLKLGGC